MKKFLIILLSVLSLAAIALGFTACENLTGGSDDAEEHVWSEMYVEEGDRHYRVCIDCNKKQYSEHSYNENGICVCGKRKDSSEEIENGHEHEYGAWSSDGATTHSRSCACNKKQTQDHQWNGGKVTKAATCKETGVKTYTCTVCGETRTETVEKLTTHAYDNGKVTKTATCKEAGERTYTCAICGDKKIEPISKLNHAFDAGKITKQPTCKDDGVKTYTCKNCGETKTETIEKTYAHSWDSGKITKQPTCIENGVRTYTCSVCNTTRTDSIAKTTTHDYDEGTVTKAPTCVKDGVRTYTCDDCGKTKTEVIAKTPDTHNFNEGTVTKAATCKEDGSKTCTCRDCGTTKTQIIPKLTTHSWNAGTVTKAATCKEEGTRLFKCTVCGTTKTEAISKLTTHSWGAWTSVDDENHKRTCSVCNKEETHAHNFNAGVCGDCGKSIGVTIGRLRYEIYKVENTGNLYGARVLGLAAVSTRSAANSLEIPMTVTYNSQTYRVYEIADNAFRGDQTLSSITIPNMVKKIGANAFMNTKLTEIDIPSSVQEIGDTAFASCYSLRSATLHSKTTGNNTFEDCPDLIEVYLEEYIEEIGYNAFASCTSLTKVKINSLSLKTIRSSAFYNVPAAVNIDYKGTKAQWDAITKDSDWHQTGTFNLCCQYGTVSAQYFTVVNWVETAQ